MRPCPQPLSSLGPWGWDRVLWPVSNEGLTFCQEYLSRSNHRLSFLHRRLFEQDLQCTLRSIFDHPVPLAAGMACLGITVEHNLQAFYPKWSCKRRHPSLRPTCSFAKAYHLSEETRWHWLNVSISRMQDDPYQWPWLAWCRPCARMDSLWSAHLQWWAGSDSRLWLLYHLQGFQVTWHSLFALISSSRA